MSSYWTCVEKVENIFWKFPVALVSISSNVCLYWAPPGDLPWGADNAGSLWLHLHQVWLSLIFFCLGLIVSNFVSTASATFSLPQLSSYWKVILAIIMVMVANFCYDNSFDTADLNDDAVGDQETMMTMISKGRVQKPQYRKFSVKGVPPFLPP